MIISRQLILDGQWDDILEFIQPLSTLANFDNNSFHFHVLKAKLIELVCIKSEGRTKFTTYLSQLFVMVQSGLLDDQEKLNWHKREWHVA